MAAVSVSTQAFTDPRIKILGKLLGGDRFLGLGYILHVWEHCTHIQSTTLAAEVLDAIGDVNGFGEILVKAGLAEALEGKSYRIRGTEGRIEWLGKLRDNGKHGSKGGRPKKENPDGLSENNPHGFPEQNPCGLEKITPITSSSSTASSSASVQKNIYINASANLKQEIDQAGKAWLETLAHFGMGRQNLLAHEDHRLGSAIQQREFRPTYACIIGARHQKRSASWDPAQFLSLDYCLGPKNFERLFNLGVQALRDGKATAPWMEQVAWVPGAPIDPNQVQS
jgi:hypothetical protein